MRAAAADAAIVARVLAPMVGLCAARAGEFLVISPNHPTHTAATVGADGHTLLRHRSLREGEWRPMLSALLKGGTVQLMTDADAAVLRRFTARSS